jgi:hypothetical protein
MAARVSQVASQAAILQTPKARVSQIVWQAAILPNRNPSPSSSTASQSSSGLGCIPKCVPYCPTDAATLKHAERGGDAMILAGLLAALAIIED